LALLETGDGGSMADVLLTEGKFHQVKRMFAAVGHPLTALSRLRIGPLELDPGLGPGEWRHLREEEVAALKEACRL
jgi:16S rRNA pseudouridine516 synthase